MWEGLVVVEKLPSPNVQVKAVLPVLVLVKDATNGEQAADTSEIKLATGFGSTFTGFLILSAQPTPVVTISVTV